MRGISVLAQEVMVSQKRAPLIGGGPCDLFRVKLCVCVAHTALLLSYGV